MTRYPGLLTAGEWIALAVVVMASIALLVYAATQ